MKIILCRKGFDSSNGGIPSLIFPDGRMLSFPIPSDDRDTYKDFVCEGIEYAQILKNLKYKGALNCHADPDLDHSRRKDSVPGWVPAFGQIGSSASYLDNIGIEEGDLFLFFGNYHFVEIDHGTIRYARNTGDFYRDHDLQVIWGYLQVGEILRTPEQQRQLTWHPHSNEKRVIDATNVIYKASETLSFDTSKPGAGILSFDKKRVLTRFGCTKATWKMNNVYDVGNIYGNRKNQAKDPTKGIYYAGIWQELGLKESEECTSWARSILSDEGIGVSKGNVLLTAERHNWGCHSVMDWRKTSYILRKDGTIVSYGVGEGSRNWGDAVAYGFISAGGGEWYSNTLKMLSQDDRIWVNIPHTGYVGVGIVAEEMQMAKDTCFMVDDKEKYMQELPLKGEYYCGEDNLEKAEYIVKVNWIKTVPEDKAVKELGFFGNQNTVCRPTSEK